MALNIENVEVERLASELASLTGESKTETVWPQAPTSELDHAPLGRAERESLLGYGPDGV
jgi:hypothetical protein